MRTLLAACGACVGLASLTFCCSIRAEGIASATVGTSFGEIGGKGAATFSTEKDAIVSISDGTLGASASAFAKAGVGLIFTGGELPPRVRITLAASAQGTGNSPPPLFARTPGNATAEASWEDELFYDDPSVLTFLLLDPFIYIRHHITGSITNRQFAQFKIEIQWDNGNKVAATSPIFNGPDTIDKDVTLRLPGDALLGKVDPITGKPIPNSGAKYKMSLSAVGGTYFAGADDETGVDGSTDFSHTAELSSIYIADANGNPIPGSEAAHIIDGSGLEYPITPAPEPTGLALLSLCATLSSRREARRG